MDNASTITDRAKSQSTVDEMVSDLAGRQDHLDDRLTTIEEKIAIIHEQLESLPDVKSKTSFVPSPRPRIIYLIPKACLLRRRVLLLLGLRPFFRHHPLHPPLVHLHSSLSLVYVKKNMSCNLLSYTHLCGV